MVENYMWMFSHNVKMKERKKETNKQTNKTHTQGEKTKWKKIKKDVKVIKYKSCMIWAPFPGISETFLFKDCLVKINKEVTSLDNTLKEGENLLLAFYISDIFAKI